MRTSTVRRRRCGSLAALFACIATLGTPLDDAAAQRAPGAEAQPSPFDAWFPSPPRVRRLANGLTVVSVRWPSPGIVAYYTLVRVGSRDEVEPGHSGFAHFFEHMMFRGTPRFPQAVYAATLSRLGADNNAFTTNDFTCYTLVGPASALATYVELEADRFQNLAYSEQVFRTEAGAVRGEYQVWSSRPEQPMWEALSEIAFRRHTYGHTTIGYLRDIDLMPTRYAYAQRFFRRFYTPDATVLIVVGDFEDATLDALVDRHYGGWRGRRDRPRIPVEPEPTGGRRDLTWSGSSPPRMMIGYRTPPFLRPGRDEPRSLRETAALDLVHGLAFHASSPLYQRLVVQERRLLELSSWVGEHHRDPGLFVIEATLAPSGPSTPSAATFDDVVVAIQNELDRIAAGQMPASRIEAARGHALYSVPMMLETPSSVAYFLAGHLAVADSLDVVRAYYRALASIGPEDVASAARAYLMPSRRYVVTLREARASANESNAAGGAS